MIIRPPQPTDPAPSPASSPGEESRLANDLYLAVHDFTCDHARLHHTVLGLVLAGGLLAELVLSNKATVGDGELTITDAGPSTDPLIHRVMADLLAEPPAARSVERCMTCLGQRQVMPAAELIAGRLITAGLLTPSPARRRLSDARLGHTPTRPTDGEGPATRIAQALHSGAALTDQDRCLAAVLRAADLTSVILPAAQPAQTAALLAQIGLLPDPLADLIGTIKAAIGEARSDRGAGSSAFLSRDSPNGVLLQKREKTCFCGFPENGGLDRSRCPGPVAVDGVPGPGPSASSGAAGRP